MLRLLFLALSALSFIGLFLGFFTSGFILLFFLFIGGASFLLYLLQPHGTLQPRLPNDWFISFGLGINISLLGIGIFLARKFIPNNINMFQVKHYFFFIVLIIFFSLIIYWVKRLILLASNKALGEPLNRSIKRNDLHDQIKKLTHENSDLKIKMQRIMENQTDPSEPFPITVDKIDTSISTALEEYRSLRSEILQQNQNRNNTLTFGATSLAALISFGGAILSDSQYKLGNTSLVLGDLVFLIFIPLLCLWIISAWTSDTATLSRIGSHLAQREIVINQWIWNLQKTKQMEMSNEGNIRIFSLPLNWENSLRNSQIIGYKYRQNCNNRSRWRNVIISFTKNENIYIAYLISVVFIVLQIFCVLYRLDLELKGIEALPQTLSILIIITSIIVAFIETEEIKDAFND